MRQLTYKKPTSYSSKQTYHTLRVDRKPSRRANLMSAQGIYQTNPRPSRKQQPIPSLKIDISTISQPKKTRVEFNESMVAAENPKRNVSYLEMKLTKSPVIDLSFTSRKSGKCLLGGALSKSMSDLGSIGRPGMLYKRVSNLPSESSTPQIFTHPPLFPQSDKNEDTRRQLNYEVEIDKLRKENIDLRGKLREKREVSNRLEYEKAKLVSEVDEGKTRLEGIMKRLESLLVESFGKEEGDGMMDQQNVKAKIEAMVNEYKGYPT